MKKIFAAVLSLALAMGLIVSMTAVSFAAEPTFKSYYYKIEIGGLDDSNEYGVIASTTKENPTGSEGYDFQWPDNGKVVAWGLKPNTKYYIYLCSRPKFSDASVTWTEYEKKTSKVPAPTVSKITAGSKSMTVKIKTSLASDARYVVQYGIKGGKTATKTFSVTEKNYSSPSFKIKGLKKGKKYVVKVKAKTYEGWVSGWSGAKTSGKIK